MKPYRLHIISITGLLAIFILFFNFIQDIDSKIESESKKLRQNIATTHDVTQPYLEHFRFRETLTKYYFQLEGVTPEQLNLRFDIYWSRIPLLIESKESQLILNLPNVLQDVREIYISLSRIDEKLKLLPELTKQNYFEIFTELQKHRKILYEIYRNGDLLQRENAEKSLNINKQIRDNITIIFTISWLISSLIFLSFILQYRKKILLSKNLNDHLYQLESTIAYRTHQLTETNKQLKALSIEDPLTSLFNRRYFDDTLSHEYSRAIRQGRKLSLLMCDIDFFKTYNDSFGHPAGDLCIMTIAKAIKFQCQRGSDIVVRYGGEEFAILLPDTSLILAVKTAEQIGNSIWENNLPVSKQNHLGRQTLSIGVVELGEDNINSQSDLISRADRFLYDAKNRGRNCVVSSLGSKTFPTNNIVRLIPGS